MRALRVGCSGAGRARWRGIGAGLAAWAVLAAAACGRPASPPSPGTFAGSVPDLRGVRVMLFPVQASEGVAGAVDAELAFALRQRSGEVVWVLPADMRRALASSPGLDARLDGLPVAVFLQAEVRRVGDPLFGYLRRMGFLVDSELALLPVAVRYREASDARASGVEIAAALVAVRSGQVLWFGVAEGEPGSADDPRALATAAEAVGLRLLPPAGG